MIRPLGDIAPNRKERMGNMYKAGVSARMDWRPLSSGFGPQGGGVSMIRAFESVARAVVARVKKSK
jgi:hypothetical protein